MTYNYPDVHLRTFIEAGSRDVLESVLQRVYGWMALGLFTTASVAAFATASSSIQVLISQPIIIFGLLLIELALVLGITWGLKRISTPAALILFFIYAALNGLTLSGLFAVYALGSVAYSFLASAVLFSTMSIIGYTTKINLSKMSSFLLTGILGLLIAMVVNLFWANSTLEWIVTFAGILFFLGLIMFDTQRIRRMTATALKKGDEDFEAHLGILGALSLYLDFVNLFLFLLRFSWRRR